MKKRRFIGFYLEDDLYRWVDEERRLRRSSMSQVVREAIVYRMGAVPRIRKNSKNSRSNA